MSTCTIYIVIVLRLVFATCNSALNQHLISKNYQITHLMLMNSMLYIANISY